MKFILFVILVIILKCSFAQKVVYITDSFQHQAISTQLLVAEDKSKILSLQQAKNLNYKPLNSNVPNFGFTNSSYWFKGNIVNTSSQWQSLVLEIDNPNIDVVTLSVFSVKTGKHTKVMTDLKPFYTRGNTSRNYQFNLKLISNDSLSFLLNVQNSGEQFHVPISLSSSSYNQQEDNDLQLLFGVYFGFILFVILLNVFFYYVLKDKSTLLYNGYLVCLLFLQLSLTGFGFKYIWPNSVFLANHANPIFASTSMFFLLLFSQEFLDIKTYLPKLNQWINRLKYVLGFIVISSFIPNPFLYQFAVLFINGLSLICIVVVIPASIYILKQNFKPARFFVTAFLFLVCSVVLFVLKNAGILPSNIITTYGLQIGTALEVLLLSLALIDKFNVFKIEAYERLQEINNLKTETNKVLEVKVEERAQQMNQQKMLLEIQNSEIKSSIRYAKRIQDSLLPPTQVLDDLFNQNYFVFYKPKDIVSGDFYWASPVNTTTDNPESFSLAAVVDCTGHGVPGAFLSIVASNLLKQSLTEHNVNGVAEALDYLNTEVMLTLNKISTPEVSVRDGMDIALISINHKKEKLYYSGANNPIYIFRSINGQPDLHVLKPTKQAIGSVLNDNKNFTVQAFDLQKGDTIYLFSDGYADQFGGEFDKKFTYKNFKNTLSEASLLPIERQQDFLETVFEKWRGNTEQTDDVCVMGIRV